MATYKHTEKLQLKHTHSEIDWALKLFQRKLFESPLKDKKYFTCLQGIPKPSAIVAQRPSYKQPVELTQGAKVA